ncbi:F1F0 ATP synthase subunit e, mitochondrial [Cystobasidiomycetes sp. EMM_F5]
MSTLNVVRYSALGFGILYGIVHRRTLQARFNSDKAAQEAHQYEHWVEQAKKEYAAKQQEGSGLLGMLERGIDKAAGAGKVISDPEDPKFDFEAWAKQFEKA